MTRGRSIGTATGVAIGLVAWACGGTTTDRSPSSSGTGGTAGAVGAGGATQAGGAVSMGGVFGSGGHSGAGASGAGGLGAGGMTLCPPCVPPPSPDCVGSGPCGCGPYVCPGSCAGQQCNPGTVCCGPAECGYCVPENSGVYCPDYCEYCAGNYRRSTASVFCAPGEALWEIQSPDFSAFLVPECQDAATGLPRYCCTPDFFPVCPR